MKIDSDCKPVKKGFFLKFLEKRKFSRFRVIADRIASLAVLDLNPELYNSDYDLYLDNNQPISCEREEESQLLLKNN